MTSSSPNQHERPSSSAMIAATVRRNAMATGFAALLMIGYGFGFGPFDLSPGTPDGLHGWSEFVFFHMLRVGGIAMAVLTVWSMIGHRAALAADGVASIAIGGLLILTGAGMFLGGGGMLQPLLNVAFGWMFISAGRHNWATYRHLGGKALGLGSGVEDVFDPHFEQSYEEARELPTGPSLASQLKDRGERRSTLEDTQPLPERPITEPDAPTPPSFDDSQVILEAPDLSSSTVPPPPPDANDESPPEGFLASFAPGEDDPNKP